MAMDSEAKEQATAGGRSTSGLLRYPLRSAKKEKPSVEDNSNSSSVSASKRGKSALSSVSNSVSILHVSGKSKEKSANQSRRFSVPSNSKDSRASVSIITPISEARSKRSETLLSDVTKSAARKKLPVLSTASYWLTQIKLSESAAKHNLSLGFFKLAYEAECEPLQRMAEELRSYVQRYDLSESEDLVKDLLECYKNFGDDPSQVSSPCSEGPNERDHLLKNDVNRSLSITTDVENTKPPKSFDENASETHQGKGRNNVPAQADELVKKMSRSSSRKMQESAQGRSKTKKPEKISAHDKENLNNAPPEDDIQEDEENMAAAEMKEIIVALEL